MHMLRPGHILLVLLLILTACAAPPPEPTATLAPTQTPTPAPTSTPFPQPTARPSALELSRAEDPSQQAFIRLIHAAPDTTTVNLYIERLAVATNVSFGQSTGAAGIVAGSYTARVVPSNSRLDEGPILYEGPVEISGEQTLLLVLSGSGSTLFLTPYPDTQEALNSTQSRVTAIHAIPGGPPVVLQQNGTDLSTVLDFGQASQPVVLPAGDTTLDFQSGEVTLLSYETFLEPQHNYQLVLISTEPGRYEIITSRTRAPGRASIRALNVTTDYGAVDMYLNAALLADDLPPGRVSDRQARTSGIYEVTVYPSTVAPITAEPLLRAQVNANDDDNLMLILLGTADNLRLLTYREDLSETAANEARVTFLNTLPSVPRVRVDTSIPALQQISDLGYGQLPDTVNLPASVSYNFQWNAVENGAFSAPVEAAEGLQFEAGRNYLYLITGQSGPPIILSEQVGFTEEPAPLTGVDAAETSDETTTPAQARFVNATIGGLPITITLNQEAAATGLVYGQASATQTVSPGEYELAVRITDSGDEIGSLETTFEAGVTYSVIAYGFGLEAAELIAIPDAEIEAGTTAPRLRLINVSQGGETELGLGISRTTQPTEGSSPFTEAPQTDTFRRSLSFGIENVTNISGVAPGNASPIGLAATGPHFLYIIDTRTSEIAGTIGPINLQPGYRYDVIAFEELDTPRIQGFVLAEVAVSD